MDLYFQWRQLLQLSGRCCSTALISALIHRTQVTFVQKYSSFFIVPLICQRHTLWYPEGERVWLRKGLTRKHHRHITVLEFPWNRDSEQESVYIISGSSWQYLFSIYLNEAIWWYLLLRMAKYRLFLSTQSRGGRFSSNLHLQTDRQENS